MIVANRRFGIVLVPVKRCTVSFFIYENTNVIIMIRELATCINSGGSASAYVRMQSSGVKEEKAEYKCARCARL